MRVVVTGGAGFIGSNFVRRILDEGSPVLPQASDVVVIDSLTYAGQQASIADMAGDPRLRLVRGDVRDAQLLHATLGGVSLVVHFAAESHVDRSIADGSQFVETNAVGTYTVLDAALRTGVERVVLVSTDEVCGSLPTAAASEDAPLRPNSPYSASKAAAELLARAMHVTHGLPVVTVRACNTYGPYQYPEKIVPLFITRLVDGETVPLYGDGGNVREWIHVDDHCRGVSLVAEKGRDGEIYNVGGGTRISNMELTGHLLRLTGRDWSSVRHVADRRGHDFRYALSTEKIEQELGFYPQIPLRSGLEKTVEWYSGNREWWEPLRDHGTASSKRAVST